MVVVAAPDGSDDDDIGAPVICFTIPSQRFSTNNSNCFISSTSLSFLWLAKWTTSGGGYGGSPDGSDDDDEEAAEAEAFNKAVKDVVERVLQEGGISGGSGQGDVKMADFESLQVPSASCLTCSGPLPTERGAGRP